ncbi:amidase [Rhodobacter capsulatus B6]|nr:amidase [Rhodobacter capsulatus B6]
MRPGPRGDGDKPPNAGGYRPDCTRRGRVRCCAMAEIVNLNRFRKQAARTEAKAAADANAAKFGRTKAQKQREEAEAAKARAALDAHRRDPEPER